MNKTNLLIVEDNAEMRKELQCALIEEHYAKTSVGSIRAAKRELKKKFYNVALIDLQLPDGTGLALLDEIKKKSKKTLTIIFTGYACLDNAIDALNEGAFAYFQKPVNIDELKVSIGKALTMQKRLADDKHVINHLTDLSLTDPHTGLHNYRYLMERLAAELKRAKRYDLPLSLIIMDIDYFKSINDVYGHRYGDFILKELGRYLLDFARGNDTVVRYGGEEFVFLLPDTNEDGAATFCQRLLDKVGKHTFDPKGKKITLNFSMGLASFPKDGINEAFGLIAAADKAMHHAKEMGGKKLFSYQGIAREGLEDRIKKSGEKGVDALKLKLSNMEDRVNKSLIEMIYIFAKKVNVNDGYTSEHVENKVTIATEIGKQLKLAHEEIKALQHAAVLHDIGKIGISDGILHKRNTLTDREYEEIKQHPEIGAEIMGPIHSLKIVVPMVLYHHERFDGSGYPSGLKGEKIPLGARIMALVDVYQALISDRPYRKAYGKKKAFNIIRRGSGTQFDPKIIDVFIRIFEEQNYASVDHHITYPGDGCRF